MVVLCKHTGGGTAREQLWAANPAIWAARGLPGPHGEVSIRAVGATFSVISTRTETEIETVRIVR